MILVMVCMESCLEVTSGKCDLRMMLVPYVKMTTYVLLKCQNRPHHKLTDSHSIMVDVLTKY